MKNADDGGPFGALRTTVRELALAPRRPIDPRYRMQHCTVQRNARSWQLHGSSRPGERSRCG